MASKRKTMGSSVLDHPTRPSVINSLFVFLLVLLDSPVARAGLSRAV
jgi:hypothetical protein